MSEDRWAGAVVVDDDDDDDLWADSPSPVKPRKSKGRRRARSRRKSKDSNKSDASSPSSPDVEANSAEDASTPSSSSSSRRKSHKENLTPPSASSSSSQTPSSKSKQKSKAKAKANARTKSRGIEPSKFHRGLSPAFNSAASTPVGNNNPGINDTDDDETPRAAIGGSSTVTNATSTGSAAHRPPLAPPPSSSAYTPLTTIASSSSSTFTSASISPPPTSLSRLKRILSDAQMRLIQNKRREVTTQLKIKRAAYRDVTELRTWPLQELALEDLDRLLDEHMGRSSGSQENGEDDRNAMNDGESNDSSNKEQLLMSGFASDSSGISTSSIEEPKRSRRGGGIVGRNAGGRSSLNPGEDSSPGKATLRARYAEEFRLERSIRPAACCRKDEGDDKEEEEEEEEENSSKADGSQLTQSDSISSTSTSTSNDNQDGSSSTTGTSNGAGQQQQQDFLPALWCMEPRIFSVEKSAAGKRRYLVGHLGRFMDMYWRKSDSRRRHYYELIREGTPCRLYLDLEFTRAANPDIDDHAAEQLVTDLIEELRADLKSVYGHDVDRSAFVDLDSSTEKKFSRHLIIHLPNQGLFVDAPAAGSFIRHVVGRLAEEIAMDQLQSRRPTLAKHLFVRTKTRDDGGKDASARTDKDTANGSGAKASSYSATQVGFADDTTCFVDMGVYTRNRLFRLLGSAKFGKPASAALRIASANTFPFPLGFGNEKFYVPDQERAAESDSHQIPVSSSSVRSGDIDDNEGDDEVDLDDPEIAQFFSSMDWSAHADALASTLVVPVNFSKINYPILQGVEEAPDISRTGRVVSSATKGSTSQKQIVRSYPKSSVGTSPFSSLDDYIADVLGSRGGSHGSIRAWSLDDSLLVNASKPCYITYHMKDNRFCERIGRQHKSNNVMWTVDLERMVCYQSCHDPECRAMGFRGELLDLPSKVQEAIREVLFDYELASLDEQVLLDKAKRESSTTRSTSNGTGIEVDEAFEKALLALDISGKNALERTFNYVDKSGDKDEWDDALSQALLTNPELFP